MNGDWSMTLSIIIPAYNAEPYIDELVNRLKPQITEEVEVIVIDDGSRWPYLAPYDWVKVHRQENAGVSAARNKGLELAAGDYIAFIDADDLVSPNYVQAILKKIHEEQFDYCYLSWESFGHWKQKVVISKETDTFPAWNLCVWNRIYKRSLIGDTRFNSKKLIAEDAEFIRHIEKGRKSFIKDVLYFYRSDTPNSLTKRFNDGKLNTKRVVYYYPEVKKDMTYLIDEFREADQDAEVILLTQKNNIPELENYAMVMSPRPIKGTELRGEKCSYFTKIELPLAADVILYMTNGQNIGGIETFIYNFCVFFAKKYKIIVIYTAYDPEQIKRLSKVVQCEKIGIGTRARCNTLIINRITDDIPKGITYGQVFQMIHTCQMNRYKVPSGRDHNIFVSEAAKKSFNGTGEVIHNLVIAEKSKSPLVLISATRLTHEKGENRMIQLAKLLNREKIQFIWIIFTTGQFKNPEPGMVFLKPTLDIMPYFQIASYIVQLSDVESFCYVIVEALSLGIPTITTDMPVLKEIGVVDGYNAHVLPMDLSGYKDIRKIDDNRLKGFKYNYQNEKIIEQWEKLLDVKTEPKQESMNYDVELKVIRPYDDTVLKRHMYKGTRITVDVDRAESLIAQRYCVRV